MDVLSTIGHAFREQMGLIGFMIIVLGIFLRLLPKWEHFKWCVEVREALIDQAEHTGDNSKAIKLRNEIKAINVKLPKYGAILAGFGAVVLILSFILPSK